MTAFEILTIVFYAVVVMIGYLICRGISTVIDNQQEMDSNLRKMYVELDDRLANIQQQLANIEDNNDRDFKNLTDIVDKMHRNLCVEIADKMVDRAYPPTYVTPCYAPNGICTNPQMDCINCPKRGTSGTWSTSTNLNKED